ncbi:hypothetical protein D3C86_1169590 [compost metagenome]
MEQRIAVDDHVVRARVLQLHGRPGREDLVGVGVDGKLGRAGGAAGVEIRGHVASANDASADQPVRRLGGPAVVEVERPCGQRGAGRRALVTRRHAQQGLQGGHAFTQAQGLGPGTAFHVRSIGDQHLGASRGHQGCELVLGQQGVERLDDAGRLAAPQRQVVFQAAGQQHAHRVALADAQVMQQVGRLVDARQQFAVAPAHRLVLGVRAAQEGQRGLVAEGGRGIAEDLVGALNRQRLGQRPRLQALDVLRGAHGERRGEWGRQGRGDWGLDHVRVPPFMPAPARCSGAGGGLRRPAGGRS